MGPARPQRADSSAAGRGAGFAPAGSARLADGLRCAHRRAGGNAAISQKLRFLHSAFPGATCPQTDYSRGLPSPAPRGYFALGGKVTKTPPGTPRTPFSPIGRRQKSAAQPLNFRRAAGSS